MQWQAGRAIFLLVVQGAPLGSARAGELVKPIGMARIIAGRSQAERSLEEANPRPTY
jgi:hypothetical protein